MELTIKIKMENAAFGETENERLVEVEKILDKWLERQQLGSGALDSVGSGTLRDSNGNTVGRWSVE